MMYIYTQKTLNKEEIRQEIIKLENKDESTLFSLYELQALYLLLIKVKGG